MKTKVESKYFILIFIVAMTIRYLWAYLSGIDNFSGPDWGRYDAQSDGILKGKFNLETSGSRFKKNHHLNLF
jgi:hypothetical protein